MLSQKSDAGHSLETASATTF